MPEDPGMSYALYRIGGSILGLGASPQDALIAAAGGAKRYMIGVTNAKGAKPGDLILVPVAKHALSAIIAGEPVTCRIVGGVLTVR